MNKLLLLLAVTYLSADISFDIDESLYQDIESKADAEFKEVTKRQQKIVKKIFTGSTSSNYTYPNNYSSQTTSQSDKTTKTVKEKKGVARVYRDGKFTIIECTSGLKRKVYHTKYGKCTTPTTFGTYSCGFAIKDASKACY